MAVLACCWCIIESIIIPDGLLKWFYLSFYIHPFFLFICQSFLWLKVLLKWLLIVFFYPFKIVCFVCLCVSKFFKNYVIYAFSFARLINIEPIEEEEEEEAESFSLVQNLNKNQIVALYSYSSIAPLSCQEKVFQLQKNYGFEENDMEDDLVSCEDEDENMEGENFRLDEDESVIDDDDDSSSACSSESFFPGSHKVGSFVDFECIFNSESFVKYVSSNKHISISSSDKPASNNIDNNEYSSLIFSSNPQPENQEMNEYSTSIFSFNSPIIELEVPKYGHEDQDLDQFYHKYTERMRWFDVLNYERTCAILNKQVGTPSSFESIETGDISMDKRARKSFLRSVESDLELVYVAQSCLSWEALHHQYIKVEALASSSFQNGVFYDTEAEEFQKFQVLLERFMEDERCGGKRVWNYVRGRFSFKSLVQVPKVSGFSEQEKEEMKIEVIKVQVLLKAIECCIQAFWIFVKSDNKKPWWKLRSSLCCSPVEDPRDLKLLIDLTRILQKKEIWLKDSQGKQRCWFRKVVNPLENQSHKKELLFTMIDMKLISRVLQLPLLSSSQLKWCQEKLDNIEFNQGKIVRACSSGPLFPA